ncbi:MAG: hypothetical protein ACXVAX_09045 [Pseudobdellovibrio sp.]
MKPLLTLILAVALSSSYAKAEEEAEIREGPCNKVLEACKAYIKSGKEKKSVYRDCMQPLLKDEKIAGLKLDDAVIKACKLKKAEIKQKK